LIIINFTSLKGHIQLMKNIFVIFSILISNFSFGQGIEFFHGTWKEAIAKAKAEGKLLFVDAYTEWCGPCKSMSKNVFTKEEVGAYFNANFINLKLDMEKEDGVTFGHQYPVRAYPTLFFLNGDGKEIKKVVGGQQVQSLLKVAGEANKGNDKSGEFEEKYKAGDRSYDLMLNYVKALNDVDKPSLKISNDYLNTTPSITEDQRLAFIMEAAVDADSKLFDVVVTNREKLVTLVSQKTFDDKCKIALDKGAEKANQFEAEEILNSLVTKAGKVLSKDESAKWAGGAKMNFYKGIKNNAKYAESYKDLAKISKKDAATLRSIATDISRNFMNDKRMVADAAEYIEAAHNLNPTVESITELVHIMVAANEVKKAIAIVTKDKEKAEKEKKELNMYNMLLDYLKSKKA
jgi:thioredoxin-related protein